MGLVAGLAVSFPVAWAMILSETVARSSGDFELLAESTTPTSNAGKDESRPNYPGLDRLPKEEQAKLLKKKIIADTAIGIPRGLVGSLGIFGVLFAMAIIQTMAAGYLLRRDGRFPEVIVAYLELSQVTVWLCAGLAVAGLVRLSLIEGFDSAPWQEFYFRISVPALVAIIGTLRSWPLELRWSMYMCWFLALAAAEDTTSIVLAILTVPVILLGLVSRGIRRLIREARESGAELAH
jgi:hypothetical protein